MNKKNYEEERFRRERNVEIYRLHKVEGSIDGKIRFELGRIVEDIVYI